MWAVADLSGGGSLLPDPTRGHLLLVTAGRKGCARIRSLPEAVCRCKLPARLQPIDCQRCRRHLSQSAYHRSHCLLGHTAIAKVATGRGIYHTAAIRDPGGRAGVWPYPPLQPAASAADCHLQQFAGSPRLCVRCPVVSLHVPLS